MTSCELTDVLENDPPNNLVPENVVLNEADAKALLNGIYTTITLRSIAHYYLYTELVPSAMIGSMSRAGFGTANAQFASNSLDFENSNVENLWTIFYRVVDLSNNVITLTDALPDSEFATGSKSEIIGEAHFLRAMATFDALRYFGQFYDVNSNLGVVLRTEPVNFVTRNKPRSTVAECYTQILADLDYAIANAPDFSVIYRGSKTAARALKAKVLLFQGNYSEAALLANEVINEGTRSLEVDFGSVFNKRFNSTEMIFATYRDENSDAIDNNRKRFYSGRAGTTWYATMMATDPRGPLTYNGSTILKVNNAATFRPTYFMRLEEMYLIQAEALAMSGASLTDASAPLNAIRVRAGIGNSTATNIAELKNDIFEEIVKELGHENGSEWFAAIRFDKAMSLKSSITSVNQYILPIPADEIFGNGSISIADQNPGYE